MSKPALKNTGDRAVAGADARPDEARSETVAWDSAVPGLGLRQRGRARTWIVQWRSGGRSRKRTLGREDAIPLLRARELARALMDGDVEGAASGDAARVAEFGTRYLADRAASWKPATQRAHARDMKGLIIPYLGTKRLDQVTRADLVIWKEALPCSPASANRALAVLSGMMRHAELLGLRPPGSNPCSGLRRRKTRFKAACLSPPEWARLGAALRQAEFDHPRAVLCIRFLALTGCRKGEALGLRWDMIDGARCALPDAKSGPRAIWLGRPARRLLAGLPRCNRFVFGAGDVPLPVTRLDAVWRALRQGAGLNHVRLHDLRHSFASVALSAGLDLRVVGGLLGHSDPGVTQGYAHLDTRTVKAASQRVGTHLEKIVGGATSRSKQSRGAGRSGAMTAARGQAGAGASLYRQFCTSPLSLDAFCAKHGLEGASFRKGLVAWRQAQRDRGARA